MYFFNKRAWLNALQKELNSINQKLQEYRKQQFAFTKNSDSDYDPELNALIHEYTTDYAYKLKEIEWVSALNLR